MDLKLGASILERKPTGVQGCLLLLAWLCHLLVEGDRAVETSKLGQFALQ